MGQKKEESLNSRLKRLKIDKSRYKDETNQLQKLGYTKEQADRVILRKNSKNTVKKLIKLHRVLTNKSFTHGELVKIAAQSGGSRNLQAVKDNHKALLRLGFDKKDILKMVAHHGGSKNLQAVKDNLEALQLLGFDNKDILKMVAHGGGSNNLQAVINNQEALRLLGFDKEAILKMVAHIGGSKNLEAVIENLEALLRFGFDKEAILKMVAHGGGSKNLQAVRECYGALQTSSLNPSDLADYFRKGKEGRERLRQALSSSVPISQDSWQLLVDDNSALFSNNPVVSTTHSDNHLTGIGNGGTTENRVNDISPLAGSAQQLSNIVQAIETNNPLPPSDSGIRKKKHTGLLELGKNKVFSHFEYSSDKKSGWFTLNPGYTCLTTRGNFAEFLNNNHLVVTRYFDNPKQDGIRLYVSLNHLGLQNATVIEVQAFFALLIRTRVYLYSKNNEVLLKKSQVTPGDSDLEIIVRFDGLVDAWRKEFPILNKTIIRDLLATWFIAAINRWREQRYDANEDHQIATEWILQHGGEFVRVTNYRLLQNNFSQSLAHWEIPLPQDLSPNPSSEVLSDQSSSSSVTPYAWDAKQQAGFDIAASPPPLLSSNGLPFGVDTPSASSGKRGREDGPGPNSTHKKHKATKEQNTFSYGTTTPSLTFFPNSIQANSSFPESSFWDECNEYRADSVRSNSDALQWDKDFGDEAPKSFRLSPNISTSTNTAATILPKNREEEGLSPYPTTPLPFFQDIVCEGEAPNNLPDNGLQQAQTDEKWLGLYY